MTENDEINLMDYIDVIKKHNKLIITIIVISMVVTGIISLLIPSIYASKAVIMPATQPRSETGMSAIAALQFGISTPSSSNASEIVSLLKSNILMEKIITKHNLYPIFFKERLKNNPEPEKIWKGIRYLKSILKINHNQKKGIIELSVEFKNPKVSANILKYTLIELTDHMSSEAKRVAETNRKYLESLIDKNSDPFIRQKIYSLIAKQIETSMMAEVKENFAFKILDPPKVPDRKIKPKIKMNILFSFAISLFAGILIAFLKEHIKKTKGINRD